MEEDVKKAFGEIKLKLNALERATQEVSRLRQILEERDSLRPRFLESSPVIRTYGGMIDSLLRQGIDEDLYIMGYFDQITLDKLSRIARYIKIISPAGALKTKKNKDALRRISKAGAEVRTHPMLHARIFCIPKRRRVLIVGSGDLQTDCFGGSRFDAGVWSNHPELINAAIDFFERVWEESDPLPEKSS